MATDSQARPSLAHQAEDSAISRKLGRRVFFILFTSFLAMIVIGAVSLDYNMHRYWEDALRQDIVRSLTQKAHMFASRLNAARGEKIQDITSQEGLNAGARITVIDGNGKIVADSEVPVKALENEGHRAEFAAALHGEVGVETRSRNTFGAPVLYVAVPVAGGAIRLAYPLADVGIASSESRKRLMLGCFVAILAAFAISALTARTVSRYRLHFSNLGRG